MLRWRGEATLHIAWLSRDKDWTSSPSLKGCVGNSNKREFEIVHCAVGEVCSSGILPKWSLNRKNLNMIAINKNNSFKMNTKIQNYYWEI
jgi:hypothetical protein